MTNIAQSTTTPSAKDVTVAIFSQLMSVMGLKHPSWVTRCLFPVFRIPIHRLSRLAVELDSNIAVMGWNAALNQFLRHLVTRLDLYGQANLPARGPLMVVCNHPAALDVGILAAAIKRDDLKILASDIPVVQMFPYIREHSIPVYYNISQRLATVRSAIHHLEAGGAIFLFPRGNVEPDPAVSPGAEQSLAGWSPSLELFLRRVPATITVVAVASGMLSPGWYKIPLIKLWKKYEQRQKVAEIFQIAAQLMTGKPPSTTPVVTFSTPLSLTDLGGGDAHEGALLASITAQARRMLQELPPY